MPDLNIPNLNRNSDKYIFKKKLSLTRKSKRRLFFESAFMFILSLFLVYINYLIPNKNLLIENLSTNFNKLYVLIIEILSNFLDIFLVFYIIISSFIILILLIGSFYRIFRIIRRKTRQISYK